MASKEMLDMLNRAIAREMQVSVQYMWQHVMWKGIKGFAVKDELKSIAITEMKHAEEIAERLVYLDGTPTTKPEPIFVGGSMQEMLERDKSDEEGAIEMYKQIIEMAKKEGDETTKRMFQRILADEEEHHDTFSGWLEEI